MTEGPAPPSTYILRELHDVAVPESVSWLPQTIGWTILAAIGLLVIALWIFRRIERWWFNRYRQEALDAIRALKKSDGRFEQELYTILSVVTRHIDGRSSPLFGADFLTQLDQKIEGNRLFSTPLGDKWLQSLVNPKLQLTNEEKNTLLECATTWIRWHKSGRSPHRLDIVDRVKVRYFALKRGKND